MKTKHPIYKAYKDGELIHRQSHAIDVKKDRLEWNAKIDSGFCDDLRLFSGAETSDGEPIYEGDILYITNKNGSVDPARVYFKQNMSQWWLGHGVLAYCLENSIITHNKPERRKGERRECDKPVERRKGDRRSERNLATDFGRRINWHDRRQS